MDLFSLVGRQTLNINPTIKNVTDNSGKLYRQFPMEGASQRGVVMKQTQGEGLIKIGPDLGSEEDGLKSMIT